jgi:hypothetical protein
VSRTFVNRSFALPRELGKRRIRADGFDRIDDAEGRTAFATLVEHDVARQEDSHVRVARDRLVCERRVARAEDDVAANVRADLPS